MLELQPKGPLFEHLPQIFKKLVSVLATSAPTTEASKKDEVVIERVPCIHYPLRFRKDPVGVRALINSGSEVNAMTPAYTSKLGLRVCQTDVGAPKIDGPTLKTFGIVLASFQVEDKQGRARYFQETFLMADTSMEVVLGMTFLTSNNANIQFAKKELT